MQSYGFSLTFLRGIGLQILARVGQGRGANSSVSLVLPCLIGSAPSFLSSTPTSISGVFTAIKAYMDTLSTRSTPASISSRADSTPPSASLILTTDSPRNRTHEADKRPLASSLDSKSNRPLNNPRRQTMQLHGNTDHQALIPLRSLQHHTKRSALGASLMGTCTTGVPLSKCLLTPAWIADTTCVIPRRWIFPGVRSCRRVHRKVTGW